MVNFNTNLTLALIINNIIKMSEEEEEYFDTEEYEEKEYIIDEIYKLYKQLKTKIHDEGMSIGANITFLKLFDFITDNREN
jgi:hypothetical protein